MSRPTDRNFDALLRRGLAAGADRPGEHASAEVLAAWSERSLDDAERGRWEEHFAHCDRCQEELAALARIPVGSPARIPWWRSLTLPSFPVARWAVAGATAVLALSVAIRLAPEAERRVAEELAAPAPPAANEREKKSVAAHPQRARVLDRYELPPPAPGEDDSFAVRTAPAPRKLEAPDERGAFRELSSEPRSDAPHAAKSARPPAAPAPAGPDAAREPLELTLRQRAAAPPAARPAPATHEPETAARAAPAAGGEPGRAGTGAVAAAPEEAQRRAAPDRDGELASFHDAPSQPKALRSAPAPAARAKEPPGFEAYGALSLDAAESSRRILIASPDRTHFWRIGDGGVIEHSEGKGGWVRQESGVEADLLGGMSPMERVCWVVGRNGTILRTVDAETWARVPAPTEADLVHAFAEDAYHATVTTTGGESYRTEDGGIHWRPLPAPSSPR